VSLLFRKDSQLRYNQKLPLEEALGVLFRWSENEAISKNHEIQMDIAKIYDPIWQDSDPWPNGPTRDRIPAFAFGNIPNEKEDFFRGFVFHSSYLILVLDYYPSFQVAQICHGTLPMESLTLEGFRSIHLRVRDSL
jgi:hypothetical protein